MAQDDRINTVDESSLPPKKPVIFHAIGGVFMGAIGVASVAVLESIIKSKTHATFKERFNFNASERSVLGSLTKDVIAGGAIGAIFNASKAITHNHAIDATMPYINKLEAERDAAVASAKDGTVR